ncbi:SulP family inorganic anion transporter [Patescibacteria group bacterium]|jgi:MFS superfamily sulfate permease-like transporter|nr:SulP family inorganic anion transporter [Patescibacteria group bacterium]MBP7842218.1 SulP family inorganic anion transporter [Patescibacteria group bacterium]
MKKETLQNQSSWATDTKSALQVMLIALPLSIGISIAAGAPPLAGLLTASIGAILASVAIYIIGGSGLTIKGPAAGLIVVIAAVILHMGYENSLGVFVVAGIVQVVLGITGLGKRVLSLISPAAIHGMLAAIGIIIISKQLYVWFGVATTDSEPLALITHLWYHIDAIKEETFMVGFVGIAIMYMLYIMKREGNEMAGKMPAALVAILVCTALGLLIGKQHHIIIPHTLSFTMPHFDGIGTLVFWEYVIMIALIGSLESLLTVKAIDPKANLNNDLTAVGIANTLVACIGGLPMISEVARSSANKSFGAQSTRSNLLHGIGVAVLIGLTFVVPILDYVPMASLAAVLIFTGYRLASRSEFVHMWHKGRDQFIVFVATIIITLLSDLLIGVVAGTLLHLAGNIRYGVKPKRLFKHGVELTEDHGIYKLWVPDAVSIFHETSIIKAISSTPDDCEMDIDFSKCNIVDGGVLEAIQSTTANRIIRIKYPENAKALAGEFSTRFRPSAN